MPRYKCNACEGEYETPQSDGAGYFHACPREKITEHVQIGPDGKVISPEVRVPWPDRRDENLRVNARGTLERKHDGAGRREV